MLRSLHASLGHRLGALSGRGGSARDSSRRRSRAGLGSGLALGGVLVLAALAYRSLAFWDPGAPGLPGIGWFVFGVSDTAPQLVIAFALALVFHRRARILRAVGEPGSPLLGVGSLLASVLLFLWGRHVDAPQFLVLSLACFVLGSGLFVFGRRVGQELVAPLLVLLFALPIPGIVLNHILLPLQRAGAAELAWLLDVCGITVLREGLVLELSHRTIRVIGTCSGLRGVIILTMLAVCWVSFFSMRRLPALLLVASAPLIALVVNAARLLLVSLNPHAELSAGHTFQGVAVFMAGIGLLCGVDALLRQRFGSGRETGETGPDTPGLPPRDWRRRLVLPALVTLALLAASLWIPAWPQTSRRVPIELPARVGGWTLADEKLPVDALFLGRALVRDHVHRRYEKAGEEVSVLVAYDDRRDFSRSVLSPKMGLPGPEWIVEEQEARALGPEGVPASRVVARSQARRVFVLHWTLGAGGLGPEMARAWLGLDRSVLRRPCASVAVRMQTEQTNDTGGARRAEARLLEVARGLRPYLATLACAASEGNPKGHLPGGRRAHKGL